MTQRIYKGSDVKLNISLIDKTGNPYRVNDVTYFSIKFYTKSIESSIECKYENETYTGIVAGETQDSAILNSAELDQLERGLLKYSYHIQVANASFTDGIYNEIVEGTTSIYLA
jgi:hypothetical protein